MKRASTVVLFLLCAWGVPSAHAAYHSFDYAAAEKPDKPVDKTRLEGWIEKVDYPDNRFRLYDPRGFERTVIARPGTIGHYRRGDFVRVNMDPDRKWMNTIEKI